MAKICFYDNILKSHTQEGDILLSGAQQPH